MSKIGIAVVIAESTLSFLHLPSLDPLPARLLPVIRGVSTVVLDDEEVRRGGTDEEGFVSLCVIKRKQALLAKVGMGRWIAIKEVPIPTGTVMARRCADILCVASTTHYSLVNLSKSQAVPLGLPISHSTESPSASTRPSMLSIIPDTSHRGPVEFLVTSHSEEQSLGVFIEASGEPSPKLVEWDSHPRALFIQYPNLISLLRNDTLQIHSLITMQRLQTIHLPASLEPRLLSSGASSLGINSSNEQSFHQHLHSLIDIGGLGRLASSTRDRSEAFAFARRHPFWKTLIRDYSKRLAVVLMTCKNAVQSLVEPIPLSRAVGLIARGKWTPLESMVDQAWREEEARRAASPNASPSHESMTISTIYSLLALRQLENLDFHSATNSMIRATLDVRVVLRLFPEIFDISQSSLYVPAAAPLHGLLSQWHSIDQMIEENLAWLYGRNILAGKPAELEWLYRQLLIRAYDMIETLLEVTSSQRSATEEPQVAQSVDTALALLYARRTAKQKLSTLLSRPDSAVEAFKIESAALKVGVPAALAELYLRRDEKSKTLSLWTQLLDGNINDDNFSRSFGDAIRLLDSCGPDVKYHFAFWAVRHNPSVGVRLLASVHDRGQPAVNYSGNEVGPVSHAFLEPRKLIEDLRAQGALSAADELLEHLAVVQEQKSSSLNEEWLEVLLSRLDTSLACEQMRDFYSQATEEYQTGGYAESFLGHLALLMASAPEPLAVLDRLKLIIFLQGFREIDIASLLTRLDGHDLLAYEHAILLGKLKRHGEALKLLGIYLRDASSAEAYCCQGGVVLSPWVAEQIIDSASAKELEPYAKFLSRNLKSAHKVRPAVKDALLRELLQAYMSNSGSSGHRRRLDVGNSGPMTVASDDTMSMAATAHLLNTQAVHMSVLDVLPLVPAEWPLSTLRTFLGRNLRRESHRRHEGSIKRAMALSHSLAKAEESWSTLRAMGGVIQDCEDSEGEEGDHNENYDATNLRNPGALAAPESALDAEKSSDASNEKFAGGILQVEHPGRVTSAKQEQDRAPFALHKDDSLPMSPP